MTLLDAIKSGNKDEVLRLLETHPDLASEQTPEGVSVLSMAMYHRQADIASIIASHKQQIDLYEACAIGDANRVADLMAADSTTLSSYSPDGFTPIALAAFFGHPDIVELLANAGADVNAQARNTMKVAAIHAAVSARDARSVEILLARGADPNLKQQNDITPLQVAEANKDERTAELLRKHGAV